VAAAEHGGARVPLRLDGEEEESDDGA
jgi:hypothetical protein